MDELCSNALDPDWLEGKKQEEEERLKNSRESVMTGHPLALGSLFFFGVRVIALGHTSLGRNFHCQFLRNVLRQFVSLVI